MSKKKKTVAIIALVLMFLIWLATITHDTLGFVTPGSDESVGFDLWAGLVWLAFLYGAWCAWRAFRLEAPKAGK